jgi:hypothetical protein
MPLLGRGTGEPTSIADQFWQYAREAILSAATAAGSAWTTARRDAQELRTPTSGPLERFRVGVVCSFCKASICLRLNARKQTEDANVYNIADTGAR